MARPLRIQYENAVYHVTCRGNAQQDIFADDHDRARFISLLQRSSETYQVSVAAFVLMRNHFHLLVRTPGANLQEFMRHFNISYTSKSWGQIFIIDKPRRLLVVFAQWPGP